MIPSLLVFVTLCALLLPLVAILQGRWTGLFWCWGACVVGQSILGFHVVRRDWLQRRQCNCPRRRRIGGALAILGLCIMVVVYVSAFWASHYCRTYYGEENLEWMMGLGFMLTAALPAELIILTVCVLVSRERSILLLQTANLASAVLPGIYGMLFL